MQRRRSVRGLVQTLAAATGALMVAAGLPTAAAAADDVVDPNLDLTITRQEVVAGGHEFGRFGAYEKLVGTAKVEVDPTDPRNIDITDLSKAPRNARGMVDYDTDFYLLRPVDMRRWNGKLFFEVNNRGNKRTFNYVNGSAVAQPALNDPAALEDFGTGFLLEQGYAVAWSGWEGDVLPGDDRMTIRLPTPTRSDGGPIEQKIVVEFHDRYFAPDGGTECLPLSGSAGFASYPAASPTADPAAELRVRPSDSPRPPGPAVPPGTVVPSSSWRFASDTELCVSGGFQPGNVYELQYTARGPRVMGVGYAATRDVVSFLRYATEDADGDANPLAVGSGVRHALGQGISSSGMYLRDFLYQGFNEDVRGRRVFDGVNVHIAGAHKLFLNYRFAQPNPYSTQHRDRYLPYVQFPFNYGARRNPLVEAGVIDGPLVDGILKRPATDPVVIHTDTSTEYWQFQAGLVSTDGFGHDVPVPGNVRQYLISGLQHASVPGATPVQGICQQLSNPTHVGPALRALVEALDGWVTRGTAAPPSRRPTITNGTLVTSDRDSTGFPHIPTVVYNGFYNDAGERDFGARDSQNRGIIDRWRQPRLVADYDVRVPRVDQVGIDRSSVKVPRVAVPTATLTGWNLRSAPHTAYDLCDLNGMSVPLPETWKDALASGDPRPSLEGLYGSHAGYVAAVRDATDALVDDRLLLERDAAVAVREAIDSDVLR